MIFGYKYVKGYEVDTKRACELGGIENTAPNRIKAITLAPEMIDRDEYMTTAVGYRVGDTLEETCRFIFVLDCGNDRDELEKRELDLTGKDTLLQAAAHILSGPFVYLYAN